MCGYIYIFWVQRQNSGFRPRLELPNPNGPGVQTVQFPVPSNKCGLIIGKGEGGEMAGRKEGEGGRERDLGI